MLGYSEVKLKNNEFTTQWLNMIDDKDINDYIRDNSSLNIKGNELKLSSTPYYKESIGEYIYNTFKGGIIIVPDQWCNKLTLASKDFYANTKKKISYDESVQLEQEYIPNWFTNKYGSFLNKEIHSDPILIRLRIAETSEILNVTLGMRILGIYGGAVLLMISLTVLALQQLSDSIEHKSRYNTIRKLGIDSKEISKLIMKQISMYFVIPIVVSIGGFVVFMNVFLIGIKQVIDIYIGDKALVFNIGIHYY